MANIFLDLPVPAVAGVGASVDVSTLGRTKTVTLDPGALVAAVELQVSVDGTNFAALDSFATSGGIEVKRTYEVAATFMRVRVSAVATSGAANMDVGANDDGALGVALTVPPADGTGASSDVSALGTFNTFVITGAFTGSLVIEASEDGVTFSPCVSVNTEGLVSKPVVAQFMRVTRAATNANNPGTPTVSVGAVNDAATGAQFNVLPVATGTGPVAVVANDYLEVDTSAAPAGYTVTLPALTTANEGRQIIVKKLTADGNPILLTPVGANTIESGAPAAPFAFGGVRAATTIIGNGTTGNWSVI